MATRFYFPLDEGAAVNPSTQGTYIQDHANVGGGHRLLTLPDGSALTNILHTNDTADHALSGAMAARKYVSDRLAAQSISGTFKLQIQGFQPNANCNQSLNVMIYVCSADGATIKETLFAQTTDSVELNTSLRNVGISGSITSATLEANDRIVVNIGTAGAPGGGAGVQGHNATFRWGCVASSGDLPENETEVGTTFRGWVEFSTTLQLASLEVSGPMKVLGTQAATLARREAQKANIYLRGSIIDADVVPPPALPFMRPAITRLTVPERRLSHLHSTFLATDVTPPTPTTGAQAPMQVPGTQAAILKRNYVSRTFMSPGIPFEMPPIGVGVFTYRDNQFVVVNLVRSGLTVPTDPGIPIDLFGITTFNAQAIKPQLLNPLLWYPPVPDVIYLPPAIGAMIMNQRTPTAQHRRPLGMVSWPGPVPADFIPPFVSPSPLGSTLKVSIGITI